MTGAQDSNAPLEIAPVDDPYVATLDVWSTVDRIAYVQEMPVTKTITKVTVGDLGSDPSCASEARVRLDVRHYPLDDHPSSNGDQLASSAAVSIPMTLSRVTWTLTSPVTLRKGQSYGFLVGGVTGVANCSTLQQRTWAHNQPTVNGGTQQCARAPDMGFSGREGFNLTPRRMWHVHGSDDRDPLCATTGGTSTSPYFDPYMPGGWLRTNKYCYGSCPKVDIVSSYPQHSNPSYRDPDCAITTGYSAGFAARRWRDLATSHPTTQWICDWTQFSAKGVRVPDGWYWGLP